MAHCDIAGVRSRVDVLDASTDQLNIDIAGSGNALAFEFDGTGPATAVTGMGVKVVRRSP